MTEEREEQRLRDNPGLANHLFKWRAQPAPWWGGVELYCTMDWMGKRWVIEDVVVKERPSEDWMTVPPTINLSMESAQVLMDDLWASGVRPAEKRDLGAGLEATKAHLADMQRIAFRLLDEILASPTCANGPSGVQ